MSFHDSLETRAPEVREAALLAALPGQLAHAKTNAPGFAKLPADVDPREITSRAALARLPVTCKSELKDRQRAALPVTSACARATYKGCERRARAPKEST